MVTIRIPLFVVRTDCVEFCGCLINSGTVSDEFAFTFLGIDFLDSISFGYGDFSMSAFALTAAM